MSGASPQAGFARQHRIVELYDPSLPEVDGDRDKLIQVFLNLVKNAAEATPAEAGRSPWSPSISTACG